MFHPFLVFVALSAGPVTDEPAPPAVPAVTQTDARKGPTEGELRAAARAKRESLGEAGGKPAPTVKGGNRPIKGQATEATTTKDTPKRVRAAGTRRNAKGPSRGKLGSTPALRGMAQTPEELVMRLVIRRLLEEELRHHENLADIQRLREQAEAKGQYHRIDSLEIFREREIKRHEQFMKKGRKRVDEKVFERALVAVEKLRAAADAEEAAEAEALRAEGEVPAAAGTAVGAEKGGKPNPADAAARKRPGAGVRPGVRPGAGAKGGKLPKQRPVKGEKSSPAPKGGEAPPASKGPAAKEKPQSAGGTGALS